MSLPVPPDHLPFTGNADADRLLAEDPLALLIGLVVIMQLTLAFGVWEVDAGAGARPA